VSVHLRSGRTNIVSVEDPVERKRRAARRAVRSAARPGLVKPFDPQVLTSRVTAVFRRPKLMAA
jgi:hypothetical protein